MRLRRYQRGFLLNPYRFEGTVQEGAMVASSDSAGTFGGASIISAAASATAEAGFIVDSDQAASGAISATGGESTLTMSGASIAAAAASATGEGALSIYATTGDISCDAADFDTNDMLYRATLTGQTNSDSFILSFWFYLDALEATDADGAIFMDANSDGTAEGNAILCDVRAADAALSIVAAATGTDLTLRKNGIIATGAWHHVLASVDIGAGIRQVAYDGTLISSWDTNTAATGSFKWGSVGSVANHYWTVGGTKFSFGELGKMDGAMAEFYFAPGQSLDLTEATNIEKFRTSDGKPVDLGADGSIPTGTTPLIYLHLDDGEAANNFGINRAGTGNFTVSGSLATRATSPSD